ncbi:YlbF family regulator [Metabacillus litoralis]|uniref:YlbF family regulator n=1 Tax=Metabacillus TaxID=2675233 RepID=UPI000EF5A1E7|nr:YlbF family regulator [Metabacillus litoralis]MCM3160374.1 YlbF family regulator [Metabacillus litoralis]MCM3408959.1 YlbF family regulator [Metabacillus litoralis]UHA59403.1 YlbF family regulator [Metabacillus litoralis]
MFATIESTLLVDQAEELANLVLQSEIVVEYRRSFNILKKDQEAQQLIQEFTKIKDLYEDVQRFGKYHPDYRKITKDLRDIKREVDLNESISNFKRAENEVQSLLDEISVQIGQAVSIHVKVPTGNPFFESSCGGGCGSGGSCGCKVS